MRKIKIFLTMLAVAGVLFATSSCVDNTESDSVAQLRKAKAAELNASADYLKAKATVDQTLATAQAALLVAQADAEKAQVGYLEALGKKEVALGEAEKLKAQAEEIKAQAVLVTAKGDSLKLAAEAAKINAQADSIIAATKIAVDKAAEELRVIIAKNDVAIENEKIALEQAYYDLEEKKIELQLEYLKLVTKFDLDAAVQYKELVVKWEAAIAAVLTQKEKLNDLYITKAKKESLLALSIIDSTAFVKKTVLALENKITKDSLDYKLAERKLSLWEDSDDTTALRNQINNLIKDTLNKAIALKEAKDAIAPLKANVEAKAAVVGTKKAAYDAVVATYQAAEDRYNNALAAYYAYLNLTIGTPTYQLGSRTNYNWTMQEGTNWHYEYKEDGSRVVIVDKYVTSLEYKGVTYSIPNPYDYLDWAHVVVFESNYLLIECTLDLNYPVQGYVDYLFTVTEKEQVPGSASYELTYSSLADYDRAIKVKKQESIDIQKVFEQVQKELTDSVKSLKSLSILEDTYRIQLRDSINELAKARTTEQAAQATLDALIADGVIAGTPFTNATNALAAATAYRIRIETIHLPHAQARYDAIHTRNTGLYDVLNDKIKELVQDAIDARNTKNRLDSEVAAFSENLTALTKLLIDGKFLTATQEADILSLTRYDLETIADKPRADLDALVYPPNSDAFKAYNEAQGALYAAEGALYAAEGNVENAEYAYTESVKLYKSTDIDFIEWQISLGGTFEDIKNKIIDLNKLKEEVIKTKATLDKDQLYLVDLLFYIENENLEKAALTAIESLRKEIAQLAIDIDKETRTLSVLELTSDSYDTAIKAFLKEYASASEEESEGE
jgi:hypothetical protein